MSFSDDFKSSIPQDTRVITVVWLSYWDEGKGKVADAWQWRFDIVAAANGWGNAWHNVMIHNKKEHFHELPGASNSAKVIYISQGRVCNLFALEKELQKLHSLQSNQKTGLVIANNTSLIVPSLQKYLDTKIEKSKKNITWSNVGSTWSWIGPGYGLKAMRLTPNVWSLLSYTDEEIKNTIRVLWDIFKELNLDDIYDEFITSRSILQDSIKNKIINIDRFNNYIPYNLDENPARNIIVECSQSVMLSLSSWSYPNCTSSECWFNGILSSLSIDNPWLKIGVIKAIPSKVGSGRFISKRWEENWISNEFIDLYRTTAWEFWATTGRPRDIGYLDIVQFKHVCRTGNEPDILWINMADMLPFLAKHNVPNKVATNYNIIHPQTKKIVNTHNTVPTENIIVDSVDYTTLSPVKNSDDYKNYVQEIRRLSWFTGPIVLWTGPGSEDNIFFP